MLVQNRDIFNGKTGDPLIFAPSVSLLYFYTFITFTFYESFMIIPST